MKIKSIFIEISSLKITPHLRNKLCFIFSFLLMLPGFYLDYYKVPEPEETKSYGKISESLVVGRLAESQKYGLFSDGGFLGFAMKKGDSVNIPASQYQIYVEKLPYSSFGTYKTISGFQAFLFGLIDKVSDFSNSNNLKIFLFINSVLLSLSLACILLFIYYYTGLLAYLFSLFAIIFSICLTAMGPNMFFSVWAFYLPLILMLFVLSYEDITGRYSQRNAIILIFTGIFIKCLFNGFEFITTILIMMMVPLFFFMIRNRWPARFFIRRLLLYSVVAIIGVILNMIILSLQISLYENSTDAGINHIFKSYHKRTSGDPKNYDFDPQVIRSLNASVADAIDIQLKGIAYRFNWKPGIVRASKESREITYKNLIVIIAFSSLLLMILIKYFSDERLRRTVWGFTLMTWVSFLAPLSWYVIFKAHAFVHVFLDLLAWYFPFVIFGASMIGFLIQAFFKCIYRFSARD